MSDDAIVDIELGESPRRGCDNVQEFVQELYDKLHRDGVELCRQDLYHEMFLCGTQSLWVMPYSHSYARMLRENGYHPQVMLSDKRGVVHVEMYENECVEMTIDTVWGWMQDFME